MKKKIDDEEFSIEETEDGEEFDLDKLLNEDDAETKKKIVAPKKRVKRSKKNTEHYVTASELSEKITVYYKSGNPDVIEESLATDIYKIANRLSFAPNFINYCTDFSTEALTQRGWLKYNEITTKDIILAYDIESKQLKWSKIKEIFINEQYEGLMHHLTTKGLDAMVTPGHKFVSQERGLQKVEYITCPENIVLTGSPVADGTGHYQDAFIELVGWAVTEGSYTLGKRTHCVRIFQKKGEKADRIRKCLNDLGAKFKEYVWDLNTEVIGFVIIKEYANKIIEVAPKKVLSMNFILSLTQQQRNHLIRTMVDGDGWIIKTPKSFAMKYVQKCKQHIDSFVALCTIAGLTTSTTFINTKSGFGNGRSKYYWVNIYSKSKLYVSAENINFHGGRPGPGGPGKLNKPNFPTIPYTGVVWCPTTEYDTMVCRRGKYIYVTGNTFREEMRGDALIKMFNALRNQKFKIDQGFNPFSYFTKIAFNAFCNRIKKEKRNRDALAAFQEEVYDSLLNHGQGGHITNTNNPSEDD